MGKIICDVCGTSYQETVTQCPICGCVRAVDAKTVPDSAEHQPASAPSSNYTYVKGGRFSKANVKKRNEAKKNIPAPGVVPDDDDNTKSRDKGLILVLVLLLLAIAAVVCYIVVRFLLPGTQTPSITPAPNATTTVPTVTTAPTVLNIPCESLELSDLIITFDKVNAVQLLDATPDPVDTTDTVEFSSSDDAVATVNTDGKIVAVGPGEAVITVTCGSAQVQCRVECTFEGEETTEPTTEPTIPAEEFKLNRTDFTLSRKGETWLLYKGDIPADQITWSSNDEKVAKVEQGKVTAVSTGRAIITAQYGQTKLECIVHCSKAVGPYTEPADEPEQDTEVVGKRYKLNTDDGRDNDITLRIGESYTLELLDNEGNAVAAAFTSSDVTVCGISKGTVTGKSQGLVTVTASYDGEIHTCIVRVR